MSRTRLSSNPMTFVSQMITLDNLQLSQGTPPYAQKYQEWKWTDKESAEVTKTRLKAQELYTVMLAKSACPPETRVEMKLLIRAFKSYDHDKLKGHNLLNKVALFGNIDDWEKTGVRRGTSLAKAPVHRREGAFSGLTAPQLSLRRLNVREHLLVVRIPEMPESRTTPPGIRSINIYCYVGTEPPANYQQYEYLGRSKRGLFIKSFENLVHVEDKRIYAWYIARYESTLGVLGLVSAPLKIEILLSVS